MKTKNNCSKPSIAFFGKCTPIKNWLFFLILIGSMPLQALETGTVTDVEGNVYKTVKIGDYWWMTENLRTRHYRNGEAVTMYPDSVFTNYGGGGPSTGGSTYDGHPHWTYVNHDSTTLAVYGRNYTWYAAMDSRGLAPEGWEVPDTSVWYTMARTIGIGTANIINGTTDYGWTKVGRYLKSSLYWQNVTASPVIDSLGFNAVPSGWMDSNGYGYFGTHCGFWTTNYVESNKSGAGRRYESFGSATDDMCLGNYRGNTTMSIRCVKKDTTTTGLASTSASATLKVKYSSAQGQLSFIGLSTSASDLTLYNINGQSVSHATATTETYSWQVGKLPQGIYVVRIKNNAGSKAVKIMAW